MGEALKPGKAALCLLVKEATTDRVIEKLRRHAGHTQLLQTNLSHTDEDHLKELLDQNLIEQSDFDAQKSAILSALVERRDPPKMKPRGSAMGMSTSQAQFRPPTEAPPSPSRGATACSWTTSSTSRAGGR